ncbi:MAG TPA: class I SAM-dependent methyltransferase [Magnetospirillaceae bacterium]
MRKTSVEYWDGVWSAETNESILDPQGRLIRHQFDRALDAAISECFKAWGSVPETLIELGCGGSIYLPYFAKRGIRIAGIDYSTRGRDQARASLAANNVPGDIYEGDIFSPPENLRGKFDVVFSAGLFEHFDDTAAAISAGKQFLRPGGLMISTIPNMRGIPGCLQRRLDRRLFDIHVPLDRDQFAEAHRRAGLTVLRSSYVMTLNFYVLQYSAESSWIGLTLRALRTAIMRSVWWSERTFAWSYPNRLTSPYVLCAARLP